MRPRGFKILLDILTRTPGPRVAEVAFTFAERPEGESEGHRGERRCAICASLAGLRLSTAEAVGRLMRFAAVDGSGVAVSLLVFDLPLLEHVGSGLPDGDALNALVPLSCAALVGQLLLAAVLQRLLYGSYALATAAALGILVLARFAVCDRWPDHTRRDNIAVTVDRPLHGER